MNKTEFVAAVAQKSEQPLSVTSKIIDNVTKTIIEALAAEDTVRIPGFGSFSVSHRKATKGRNPATGETIDLPARNSAKFTPGKTFKEALNK